MGDELTYDEVNIRLEKLEQWVDWLYTWQHDEWVELLDSYHSAAQRALGISTYEIANTILCFAEKELEVIDEKWARAYNITTPEALADLKELLGEKRPPVWAIRIQGESRPFDNEEAANLFLNAVRALDLSATKIKY